MRKEEYPPLFSAGFHTLTLAKLRTLCVDEFPLSRTRSSLMNNLDAICDKLVDAEVTGDLWIDGSFLTAKIDPADVDVVLRSESAFYENCSKKAREAIAWLGSNLKSAYNCDSYYFVTWPVGHPQYELGEWYRRKYIRLFSISRRDEVKGIVLVRLERRE